MEHCVYKKFLDLRIQYQVKPHISPKSFQHHHRDNHQTKANKHYV